MECDLLLPANTDKTKVQRMTTVINRRLPRVTQSSEFDHLCNKVYVCVWVWQASRVNNDKRKIFLLTKRFFDGLSNSSETFYQKWNRSLRGSRKWANLYFPPPLLVDYPRMAWQRKKFHLSMSAHGGNVQQAYHIARHSSFALVVYLEWNAMKHQTLRAGVHNSLKVKNTQFAFREFERKKGRKFMPRGRLWGA